MSIGNEDHVSFAGAAQSLLDDVMSDEWGQVSLSVYETARLVALAPWLDGHSARLEFLCQQQAADGSWGSPDGYAFVPTLSATEALLSSLRRPTDAGAISRQRVLLAATRGLRALQQWLRADSGYSVPDTIAVEIIAPVLVAQINTHLDHLSTESTPATGGGLPHVALPMPTGIQPVPLVAVRAALGRRDVHAMKLWASLEAIAHGSRSCRSSSRQTARSLLAAATPMWLGWSPVDDFRPGRTCTGFRRAAVGQSWGTPITYFERRGPAASPPLIWRTPCLTECWISSREDRGARSARRAWFPRTPMTQRASCMRSRSTADRVAGSLLHYRSDGYFTCFPSERTPSTSTNAHLWRPLAPIWIIALRIAAGSIRLKMVTTGCPKPAAGWDWYTEWHGVGLLRDRVKCARRSEVSARALGRGDSRGGGLGVGDAASPWFVGALGGDHRGNRLRGTDPAPRRDREARASGGSCGDGRVLVSCGV